MGVLRLAGQRRPLRLRRPPRHVRLADRRPSAGLRDVHQRPDRGRWRSVWNGSSWAMQQTPDQSPATLVHGGVVHLRHGLHRSRDDGEARRWRSAGTAPAGRSSRTPTGPAPTASWWGVVPASAAACTAVGQDFGAAAPLAERWDGTSWTIETTPNPKPGTAASLLQGVSCASASAVHRRGRLGQHASANPPGQFNSPLAEVWDGTSWTILPTVNPDPGGSGHLTGVSCTSSTSCMAVGTGPADPGTTGTGPPGPTQDAANSGQGAALDGVSCTSATACTAVGSYFNGTHPSRWRNAGTAAPGRCSPPPVPAASPTS